MSQSKDLWQVQKDETHSMYLVVKGESDVALGVVYSTRERAQTTADKLNESQPTVPAA